MIRRPVLIVVAVICGFAGAVLEFLEIDRTLSTAIVVAFAWMMTEVGK